MITTAPGEEAQVDYGDGPMVRHPDDRQVPAHAALRPDARLLAQSRCACWCGSRARRSGPSCTSARFGDSAARRASSSSTISKKACSRRTSTSPTLNPLYRDVLAHYGVVALPCRVGDPDRKGKVESGIGHTQKTPLQGHALRDARRRRRPISIAGRRTGPTRASTARRSARSPRCLPRSSPRCSRCPLEPFRYYRFGVRTVHLDGCVEVEAAYYGAPPGLDRPARPRAVERPPRAAARSEDRAAAARACARAARLAPHRRRGSPARTPAKTLALLGARASRRRRDRHRLRPHPPARRRRRRPPHPRRARARQETRPRRRRRRRQGGPRARRARRIASSAAISSAGPPVPLTLRQVDPLIRQLTLYRDLIDRRTGDPYMNLVELDRALRKLRLSGMAAVLETRLRQAQTEKTGAHRSRLRARHRRTRAGDRTGCSSAATSRRASAIPSARSTPSISISTRR